MAHEVETMMYAGEVPWHKLGKKVAGLQTAAEAIVAAGLNWEVNLVDVFVRDPYLRSGFRKATDFRAVERVKDHKVLGVVSPEYQPVQNKDAFAFFDSVVGNKDSKYETAGSLRGGKRTWILASLKGSASVKGDEVKKYLTLVNGHDGSLALQVFWTPVRVVCMNTLQMAMSGATNRVYIRHIGDVMSRVETAREILGLANKFYDGWLKQARRLATLALPPAQMPQLLMASFQTTGAQKIEDVYKPTQLAMRNVEELVEVDRKEFPVATHGTAWEAYNAIAKHTDYYRQYRSKAEDARLYGAWFGSGMDIKKRAWDYLVKL